MISGPNGSGKSGVVDAIQFGLTGEISRLSGKGTAGLSVQKHGPHVDRRDDPAAAEVSLTLHFPERGKTAVLTRNIKTAKTFRLEPEDAGVRALVEGCLRCLLLVMCTHPFAKEALTLHLARSEGHERYFGCNLMHCKVLALSHQHLIAEAPYALTGEDVE